MNQNTLVAKVTAAVTKRGTATVDHLVIDFPDVTRKKLQAALGNARDARLLRVKVRGNFNAKRASIWEPGAQVELPKPVKRETPRLRLPSVWALGTPPEWTGEWPPLAVGRSFAPLGEWVVAEAE